MILCILCSIGEECSRMNHGEVGSVFLVQEIWISVKRNKKQWSGNSYYKWIQRLQNQWNRTWSALLSVLQSYSGELNCSTCSLCYHPFHAYFWVNCWFRLTDICKIDQKLIFSFLGQKLQSIMWQAGILLHFFYKNNSICNIFPYQ